MEPIKLIPLHQGRAEVWANGAENQSVHLTYDVSNYLKAWPDAQPSVAFERADGEKYPHAWELDGPVLHIPLLLADTEIPGMCKCMITMLSGDGRANTVVFYGSVTEGIDSLGEEPDEPSRGIIEQVNAAAANASISAQTAADAAQAAEEAAKNAQESLENMEERYYVPNVDDEGNLSFTPTSDEMPAVPATNIRGEKGEKGDSGLPDHTEADAGKILYIAPDGTAAWLKVGSGLKIENGTLMLNLSPSGGGDIYITENADGSVTLNGVSFVEQADGMVLLENATFTAQADGSVLIQ